MRGNKKRKKSFMISSIFSCFTIYKCVVNIMIYSGVIVFCTRLRNKQGGGGGGGGGDKTITGLSIYHNIITLFSIN